eukprot:jgi/Picsp_1/1914/NSC_05380-R1_riboflavin kinase
MYVELATQIDVVVVLEEEGKEQGKEYGCQGLRGECIVEQGVPAALLDYLHSLLVHRRTIGLKYTYEGLTQVEGRIRMSSVGETSGSITNSGNDPTAFAWLSSLIGPSDRVLNIDDLENSPVLAAMDCESAPRDIVHLTQRHEAKGRPGGEKANVLGNEPGVRTWNGTIESLPSYMGPFEAICAQASALYSEHDGQVGAQFEEARLGAALQKASLMMRPGGKMILWYEDSELVNAECIRKLVHNLCFELLEASVSPGGHHRVAILEVPQNFALSSAPLYLEGTVVTGYGRGSKDLGVPTANLDPLGVENCVKGLPDGVYFGWAQLDASDAACLEDRSVHKMVMNIGNRPTYVEDNSPEKSIEVHVMHKYGDDFYGKRVKVIMLGYLRPELKFSGLKELLHRIHTDIGIARSQLDVDRWLKYADDSFFD